MIKQNAFTLIELMLAIAIGGILMAVALPNYTSMTKNNCLTTAVNSLVANLQRARSEAVKRRTDVTITATGGSWTNGWTVTMDEDRDDDDVLDTGEDFDGDGALDAAVTIQSAALTCGATIAETGGDTAFTYESDGFIDVAGTFSICDDRTAERGRQLTISVSGRPNLNSDFTCD